MMSSIQPSVDLIYDAAWALNPGRREQQEDAVAADFPLGSGLGFAVLADGMGGHAAGDIASKIVVTEIFSELKMLADDPAHLEQNIQQSLRDALAGANFCVEQFARQNPEAVGMGSTLVAPVLFDNRMYWISVGDSPLFLFRDGQLSQINEDHSMAAEIDFLCRQGVIDSHDAATHPDRQCLTSAIAGHEIPHIDCTETPLTLRAGDVVIAASDGIQFLSNNQIEWILITLRDRSSAEISAALLSEIKALDHAEQDNISLCVIKMNAAGKLAEKSDLILKTRPPEDGKNNGQKTRIVTAFRNKSEQSSDAAYRSSA